jgi:hypothetical protein
MVLSNHEHKGSTNDNDGTKQSWNETNLKTKQTSKQLNNQPLTKHLSKQNQQWMKQKL